MAWNRGQMSAEEILGMKPEDLKAKLDSAVTKEDLTATQTKIEEQAGALAKIQEMLAKLTTPTPEPDPVVVADSEDPTTQMLTDPQGFISRSTKGIAETASQARADILEMRARNAYARAFAKYGKELMEGAKSFSLAQRAQDGFWDFHIRTFMGDKYIKGETGSGSYPSLLGSSTISSTHMEDPDDPNKGFNPEVASFLKERGVPLEKAAKIKLLMADQGEPISLASYKEKANA